MNYFDDQENDDQTFRDTPDEIDEKRTADPVSVRSAKPAGAQPQQPVQQRQAAPVQQPQEEYYEGEEDISEEEEEENISDVLSDARLRLEQGKLYEMLMNHNIFDQVDSDERAIKSVSKEIRKFAQERMELMLGMRQTVQAAPDAPQAMAREEFPFNQLEVEVLKSLAAAATKGASRESDAFVPEPVPVTRKTLNPIGGARTAPKQVPRPLAKAAPAARKPLPQKPPQQVRRPKVDEAVQRILEEEGVTLEELNRTFPPDYKPLANDMAGLYDLDPEQIKARNAELAKRTHKQVSSPAAVPMPSQEQINSMIEQKVQASAQTMAANPNFNTIMNLLNQRK